MHGRIPLPPEDDDDEVEEDLLRMEGSPVDEVVAEQLLR